MPIEVSEKYSGRLLVRQSGAWVARRCFTVTGTEDPDAAIAAIGVPHAAGHPDNGNMRAAVFNATATGKGPFDWTVTVDYLFGDVGAGASNPVDEPPQILPDVAGQTEPFQWDLDYENIFNSAGDPPDPPSTRFVPIVSFIVRRAMPFYSLATSLAITRHVNNSPINVANFGVADTEQMFCEYYRPSEAYTHLAPYVFVEFRVMIKDGVRPWQPRRVDAGRWGWYTDPDTGSPEKGPICDSTGNLVDFDVRLDAEGKPLDSRFKILKSGNAGGAPEIIDPDSNPSVPSNITEDPATQNNSKITILIDKQVPLGDFSPIFG